MNAPVHTGLPADLNVVGDPAPLLGQTCLELICTEFVEDGRITDEANETLIRTLDGWTQLCFDCGLVFWRPDRHAPEPYEAAPDTGEASIVLKDVAAVRGQLITGIETDIGEAVTVVILRFQNGAHVRLISSVADDTTEVRVSPASAAEKHPTHAR
ncbi:MAG: hypothetical protein Q7T61_15810 [Caulobacter sp.]|nr:hypothetical protein [Caulobacter sp.]